MNQKQIIKDKITKRFVRTVYLDIALAICIITLVIIIPIIFAIIFTPNLIVEEGYLNTWGIWLMGIGIICLGLALIIKLFISWIKLRWGKAEEKVMEQIMINENARRSERFK